MQSEKKGLINTVMFVFMILLVMLSSQVRADEKQWVVFHDNIPEDVERISIDLKFTKSSSRFYETSRHEIISVEIEKGRRKDEYKQRLDLGKAADGNQYSIMVKDATDINIISQGSERLCMAKVLRTKGDKKPDVIKEGLLFLNRDLKIPLKVSTEKLMVPFKEPVKGVLEVRVYSNNRPVYESRSRTIVNGTLSGSTSTEKAFLNASINCKGSLGLKGRQLNLSLKPFDDKMASTSCKGKISDTLMLGSAKIVVEKAASDSSELVLALLDGEMVTMKKQVDTLADVGKAFPAFARVELISRQLLTLDDLKKEAGPEGYIVLVFGDFKMAMPEYYGGRPPMRNLPLDEMMIFDILKKDCDKSIVIAFVCQQLSMAYLYEKWLGRDPEFLVLSDFSNPLNMQFFGVGMDPHMYHNRDAAETLRGKLKYENEKVITALIDGNGNLVYLNTNAGNELSGSLVQINNFMKEGKKAEHKD